MQPLLLRFVLAVLATWRVSHLLANEDGPADLIFRIRTLLGHGFAGRLMDCFNCLSLWIAALAALFVTRGPMEWLLVWLALSGAACLLEAMITDPVVLPAARESSEGGINNVLQSETFAAAEQPRTDQDAERRSIPFR